MTMQYAKVPRKSCRDCAMIYSSQNGQGKTSEWTKQGLHGGNGGWRHGIWAGWDQYEARVWGEGVECAPRQAKGGKREAPPKK